VGELIASAGGLEAVTLFTEDLPRTAAFYRDVFGLPQLFEDDDSVAFRLGSTVVNVLRVQAAPELVEPTPVGGPEAGPRVLLTVHVEDVDAVRAELAERGTAPLNGPVDRPWGVRTMAVADPAGHAWEFATPLAQPTG
jgi:catechol 2,3-dioxygenase-like lactoylglutathione lyase family enzyme